jgi:hypothetical protein
LIPKPIGVLHVPRFVYFVNNIPYSSKLIS